MKIIKKYKTLSILVLVVIAGIFYFFNNFGRHDAQALTDFSLAYASFDKAISDFSIALLETNFEGAIATENLGLNADKALVELTSKASVRISSLTINDAELMSLTQEIAELSQKELNTLIAYKRAVADKNADADKLANELSDMTNKRQTAYARFRALAGLKD